MIKIANPEVIHLPDRDEFEALYAEMEKGHKLTFDDLGMVFGAPFWTLVIQEFLDSREQEAGRNEAPGE